MAKGDLSRKITVDVRGELLELKNTINTMVDQLNAFASESRASPAGSARKASSAARHKYPGSPARERFEADNVNSMANNLTGQVRNIAEVTTAVAKGDLSRKITVDGTPEEILGIERHHQHAMVDQLNGFAAEVTRVAREVGTEGQARRSGASARRGGDLEKFDGQREFHGEQPDNASAQHRRRDDCHWHWAISLKQDHRGRERQEILELKNTIKLMR